MNYLRDEMVIRIIERLGDDALSKPLAGTTRWRSTIATMFMLHNHIPGDDEMLLTKAQRNELKTFVLTIDMFAQLTDTQLVDMFEYVIRRFYTQM